MEKIDFKNELIYATMNGETNIFLSETLTTIEMFLLCYEHKFEIMEEEFNFEVDKSDYFEHNFNDEVFNVVYAKYKTVVLFGFEITMHLLNDEYFQSESTIIYQVEKV